MGVGLVPVRSRDFEWTTGTKGSNSSGVEMGGRTGVVISSGPEDSTCGIGAIRAVNFGSSECVNLFFVDSDDFLWLLYKSEKKSTRKSKGRS